MLIEELLNENPPGISKFSAFKSNAKSKIAGLKSQASAKILGPKKQRIAKQNRKKWLAQVKKLQNSGKNVADENVYRSYLQDFLSGNNRLNLSQELKTMIAQGELTNDILLDIMTKAVDDRIAAKQSQSGEAA